MLKASQFEKVLVFKYLFLSILCWKTTSWTLFTGKRFSSSSKSICINFNEPLLLETENLPFSSHHPKTLCVNPFHFFAALYLNFCHTWQHETVLSSDLLLNFCSSHSKFTCNHIVWSHRSHSPKNLIKVLNWVSILHTIQGKDYLSCSI